jgi:cellulose synthase operon protein C
MLAILPFAIGLPCLAQTNFAPQSVDSPPQTALVYGSIDAVSSNTGSLKGPDTVETQGQEREDETGSGNEGPIPGPETTASESTEDAAEAAFDDKRFLSAWRLNPASYPLLSGIDSPLARAGIGWFDKSGDPGTSRLQEWSTIPTGFVTSGEDVFGIGLALISLDAGQPGPNAEIGTPGPRVAEPTTNLGIGIAPEIAWKHEGTTSPWIELGSTPFNGVVGPTFAGRLGAVLEFGQTKITPEFYRRSIAESILSYTGIVDPGTGRGFGRVVETGGKVEIEQPLTKRWSLDVSTSAGSVTGVSVAQNAHFSVEINPSYDLHLPHFDAFTIGPSIAFESFNRNLSGFTFGQGGYFSPQYDNDVGVAIDFQSEEGRDFIIRGNLSAGWETNYQASSPIFPLNDTGERFPAKHQSGAGISGEISFAYRMSARLSLGGMVECRESPQYNDILVGLILKLSFSPRRALFSSDLPNRASLLGAPER